MDSKLKNKYNKTFLNQKNIAYPAEYVIRIFKGDYPKLKLSKKKFLNKKICDVSCGDGRNLVFLNQCGFDTYGTEISQEIVNKTKKNLSKFKIKSTLKIGTNSEINFDNDFFDYLLSWNSVYYMGENLDFNLHIDEYARVLKNKGHSIMAIPKLAFHYFKGSKKIKPGYCIIKNDPLTPFLTIIVKKNGEVFIDSKNRKKELQKKDYLEILRARKPSEISLKIDSETPSEYFLKILKILENEKIKKVVIETNYLKE